MKIADIEVLNSIESLLEIDGSLRQQFGKITKEEFSSSIRIYSNVLSNREIANICKVSTSSVSRWINNRSVPPLSLARYGILEIISNEILNPERSSYLIKTVQLFKNKSLIASIIAVLCSYKKYGLEGSVLIGLVLRRINIGELKDHNLVHSRLIEANIINQHFIPKVDEAISRQIANLSRDIAKRKISSFDEIRKYLDSIEKDDLIESYSKVFCTT